jgi:hypothetical protein
MQDAQDAQQDGIRAAKPYSFYRPKKLIGCEDKLAIQAFQFCKTIVFFWQYRRHTATDGNQQHIIIQVICLFLNILMF